MNTLDDKLRIRLEKSLRDRLKLVAGKMRRKEGAVARLAIEDYVNRLEGRNGRTKLKRLIEPKP